MSVPWVRIGDVLRRRLDTVPIEASGTYGLLGVRNAARGAFDAGEIAGSATSYKVLYRAHAGDLVYLKLGAWERAFATVPDSLDGRHASSEFVMYEPDATAMDGGYLAHLVGWDRLVAGIGAKSTGTNVRRRRLKPETFEEAMIPLPDLDEQRRIAARLDAIASCAEAAGASRNLNGLRASLWSGLRGGGTAKLGEILREVPRPRRVDTSTVYRMLGVRWYGEGLFVRESKLGSELRARTVYEIAPGDIVYNRLFAWKGSFALADASHAGTFASNEFPAFAVKSDGISPEYVVAWLCRPEVWELAEEASTGSTPTSRNRLKIERFLDLEISLPASSDRLGIARALRALNRIQALSGQQGRLAAALLPAARNEEFTRLTSA